MRIGVNVLRLAGKASGGVTGTATTRRASRGRSRLALCVVLYVYILRAHWRTARARGAPHVRKRALRGSRDIACEATAARATQRHVALRRRRHTVGIALDWPGARRTAQRRPRAVTGDEMQSLGGIVCIRTWLAHVSSKCAPRREGLAHRLHRNVTRPVADLPRRPPTGPEGPRESAANGLYRARAWMFQGQG